MTNTRADASNLLAAFATQASFAMPNLLVRRSAWLEHAPFGSWLVDALRPKSIVELGCYAGFSYFVFCQAVQVAGLDCSCYAIDTWEGDEYTGRVGEEVFREVSDYNNSHFNSFSSLIRSTFSQAVSHFESGSIDLLHIDGNHSYAAVESDYKTWRSRLSNSGIILFHDINVRERNFGVSRLWAELKQGHRHFEFLHGHGLGVLAIGDQLPARLEQLFDCSSDVGAVNEIRQVFSRLGRAIADRAECDALHVELATAQVQITNMADTMREKDLEVAQAESNLANENQKLKLAIGRYENRQNYLFAVVSEKEASISQKEQEIQSLLREIESLRTAIRNIFSSNSWRVTRPFRVIARLVRTGRLR